MTAIPIYAQSTLAIQEKCTEGAKKLVEDSKEVTAYTSHYNKNLDKCFMRVRINFAPIEVDVKGAKGKIIKQRFWMVSLVNVFEKKFIGEFAYLGMEMQVCWFGNTRCEPIDEFEKLIRAYMEE